MRRLFSHHVEKLIEEWTCVVRTRGRFRVILDRKNRQLAMSEPFDGPVIQIHVRYFQLGDARNAGFATTSRHGILSAIAAVTLPVVSCEREVDLWQVNWKAGLPS